jgi:hypothetical protein
MGKTGRSRVGVKILDKQGKMIERGKGKQSKGD